ncbi:MAG: hypothetical protein Rubg2KO_24580 [Rubricoccaceae bacterium]
MSLGMLRYALALTALLAASPVAAQFDESNIDALTVSVASNASVYAEGETIEVSVTIANPTDSSAVLHGAPGCTVWFTLDAFESSEWTPCALADLPILFPAYSARVYSWVLDPADFGLPLSGGSHQLVGYAIVGEPDTTTFEAPAATGGRVYFTGAPGLTHDDLASLRDSLAADVLFEADRPSGGILGRWRVRGAPLDSIVARYQSDPRFLDFEAIREMEPPAEAFIADKEEPVALHLRVRAFPNPASERIELAIRARSTEPVAVEVFDALGRLMHERTGVRGRGSLLLDVRDWPPGIYTAHVRTRDANSTLRFTVAR